MDSPSLPHHISSPTSPGSAASSSMVQTTTPTPLPMSSNSSGPQIRSRITVVCAECKRLKLKCDRRNPCGSCTKRDTVQRCIYSPAAAEKVDLHSLNNRLIHVESALAQLTSGTSSAPFVSVYSSTPSTFGRVSHSNTSHLTSASSNLNRQSFGPDAPGSAEPATQASFGLGSHAVSFLNTPRVRGDGSALSIHLCGIVDTYLADMFTPGSSTSLSYEDKRLLQAVGLDTGFTEAEFRSDLPQRACSSTPNVEPFAVKTESNPISLQNSRFDLSSPSAMMPNTDPAMRDSNPASLNVYSFPSSISFSGNESGESGVNCAVQSPWPFVSSHALPSLEAYHVHNASSNHPSIPPDQPQYGLAFSTTQVGPSPSASGVGVTSAVLDYLPSDAKLVQSSLTTVRAYEYGNGLDEEWDALEQRSLQLFARRSIPPDSATRPGLESLTFFACLASLLALGGEILRQSSQESRGVEGTSLDHTTSTQYPMSQIPSSHHSGPEADNSASPAFLYALSTQALSVADLQLRGMTPDLEYVQTCLWQIKYLCLIARTRSKRREGLENTLVSLVGKTVNLARQLGLGRDPNDEFSQGSHQESNDSSRNPEYGGGGRSGHRPLDEQNLAAGTSETAIDSSGIHIGTKETVRGKRRLKLKGREKERRRRLWWEVVYYDVLLSDCLRHAPLIGSTHVPTPALPESDHRNSNEADTISTVPHRFYVQRIFDPSSLLYERSAPYTTRLPQDLTGFGSSNEKEAGYFEIKYRFAQLVKSTQLHTALGSGYTLEVAGVYDTEIREYLAALGIGVVGGDLAGPHREESPEVNVESEAQTLRRLQKCEVAITGHRLLIKLYWPFLRHPQTSANLPLIPRHVTYSIVESAHGIIHTARSYSSLLGGGSGTGLHPTPSGLFRPNMFLFYDLGRIVFDAAVICAHVGIKQPNSMWAQQAREDVSIAANVLETSCLRLHWGRAIEGDVATSEQLGKPSDLNWQHALAIIRLLRAKLEGLQRPSSTGPDVDAYPDNHGLLKRKHSQINSSQSKSVEISALAIEEDEARYGHPNQDNFHHPTNAFPKQAASTGKVHSSSSSPISSAQHRSPQSSPRSQRPRDRRDSALLTRKPLPVRHAPGVEPQRGDSVSRRSDVAPSSSTAVGEPPFQGGSVLPIDAGRGRQAKKEAQPNDSPDKAKGKGKGKEEKQKERERSKRPSIGLRARDGISPFKDAQIPFKPSGGRSSASSQSSQSSVGEAQGDVFSVIPRTQPTPLTVGVVGGSAPVPSSPAEHRYSASNNSPHQFMHSPQQQTAVQEPAGSNAHTYRSRSSSINQDPRMQRFQAQQMMHTQTHDQSAGYTMVQESRARFQEYGPAPPSMSHFSLSPQNRTVYDAMGSLDPSPYGHNGQLSVDQGPTGSYMSASGSYGSLAASSRTMSTTNSPYALAGSNSLPPSTRGTASGMSSHQPSPPLFGTPGPPSSATSTASQAFNMPPPNNAGYGLSPYGVHAQQGGISTDAYNMEPLTPVYEKSDQQAMYDVKPAMDSLPPSSQVVHSSLQSMQPVFQPQEQSIHQEGEAHGQHGQHGMVMDTSQPQSWPVDSASGQLAEQQQNNSYWSVDESRYF